MDTTQQPINQERVLTIWESAKAFLVDGNLCQNFSFRLEEDDSTIEFIYRDGDQKEHWIILTPHQIGLGTIDGNTLSVPFRRGRDVKILALGEIAL